VFPAAEPLIVVSATAGGSAAAQADRPCARAGRHVAALCAGPVGAWAVAGVGLFAYTATLRDLLGGL
jgi:predicted metal-binding membrane protein